MCANILPYSFFLKKISWDINLSTDCLPSELSRRERCLWKALQEPKLHVFSVSFTERFLSWILIANNMILGKRENTEGLENNKIIIQLFQQCS